MAGEVNKRIQQLKTKLSSQNLAKQAFKVFKDTTPVAPVNGGNAKRNTILKGSEIQANYPYAGVLDKGRHLTPKGMRGSKQAPDGMSKPTDKFIVNYIKKQTKRKP